METFLATGAGSVAFSIGLGQYDRILPNEIWIEQPRTGISGAEVEELLRPQQSARGHR
jgi:hypothetical protein